MSFGNFMNKVRQWDNRSNQWFVRHFYVLFFEIILVMTFVFFFTLIIKTINIASDTANPTTIEKLLLNQNYLGLLIVFLILINSFWMLFMFSGMLKIRAILKNIDFSLSRRHPSRRDTETDI